MIGQTILGYTLKEEVGSGGFGTVYKGEKVNPSGVYIRAIKHISLPTKKQYIDVLNSMGGDYSKADDYFAAVLKDIVSEIQILNHLTEQGVHNVVSYFENQIDESKSPLKYDIYILMEFVASFPDYLEENSFAVKDVIRLGKDILTALIACHKNQIIHRDIKDDNIFVGNDGSFKLGDFGVSKKLQDRSRAKSMKGTPNYIAPEVYLGKGTYDHTVDLYSLGIVLYKLLNYNRNPFMPAFPAPYSSMDEEQAFEKRMKYEEPGLPLNAENALGNVVLKAISRRENRYNNAEEFYAALCTAEKQMSNEGLNKIVINNPPKKNERQQKIDGGAENTVGASNKNFGETVAEAQSSEFNSSGKKEEDNRNANLFETVADRNIPTGDNASGTPLFEDSASSNRTNHNSNNPAPPQVEAIQKKSFDWIFYVLPFAIALIYALIYFMYLPHLYDKTISTMDWIIKNPNALLESLKNSQTVFHPFYKILFWKILNYIFYAGFIASLYFLGRKLHFSKPDHAENAGLKDQEAYYLSMQIYNEMKHLTPAVSKEVLNAVKAVNDRLKNESNFGYGNDQVIRCEQEIESLLNLISSNIAGLQNQNTADTVGHAMIASCNKILAKLKIRTELKKK